MKLTNLVAVVTDGAQGLGRYITEELLMNKCRVVITGDNKQVADSFLNEAHQNNYDDKSIKFIKCNIRNYDEIKVMIECAHAWYGQIDILINTAGMFSKEPDQAREVVETKLCATIDATYEAVKLMDSQSSGGVVVNVSSAAGLTIQKISAIFTASESAVVAFTRAMAASNVVSNSKVRVNCLVPGVVDTDVDKKSSWARRPSNQEYVKRAGYVSVSDAVKGFLRCIDGEKNGTVISVSSKDGIKEE